MTSTAPGAHPSPEEVDALLDRSGGDAHVGAHVGAHVAVCDSCAAVRDELLQVRALLGEQARTLPPEPADLGARIAAALAAEPPLTPSVTASAPRTTSGPREAPSAPRGPGTVVSLADQRRRPWGTWLAAAASVAVIGAGGTFLLGQVTGGASDAAGSAAEAPALSPQDSSAEGGGPENVPAPSAGGSTDGATGGSVEGSMGASAAGPLLSSRTAYDADDLVAQARSLLTTAQDLESVPERSRVEGYEVSADSSLAACLVAIGRPGAEPVVTDLATFEGQQAAVVVVPGRDGFEVLVVPSGCGAGDDRVLARTTLD